MRRSSPPRAVSLATLALAVACVAHSAPARATAKRAPVQYTVAIPRPTDQYVHVTLTVTDPRGKASDVALPAWAPGSYLIRDFARHVYDVRAVDRSGRPLGVTRRDKQTWTVAHGGRPFTVRYRVFANEVGVRTSHIDDRHASLIGTSVFMYLPGELSRGASVDIELPDGWDAHVALPTAPAGEGHVTVTAASYDALVDAPIELGNPHVETFEVDGTQFSYVLTAADTLTADPKRLAADAEKIVTAFGELMGGFPMKRYLFLVEATAEGGGGLEHAASTSMILRRGMFASPGGYDRAAHLAAHEFFHLWNVKRIHDRVLGPFDYSRENHSRLLWFHEGFTETMERLAMRRAGLTEADEFLEGLAGHYTRYRARPGRNHDPLSQMSFEAWVKGYRPAENHRNVAISYYTKGDVVGVALDLELRIRSAARGKDGSLPGLFRRLQASHGRTGRGITGQDIVSAASAEAGEDMGWFFARYVDGTDEVELEPLLSQIGVKVTVKPGEGIFTGLRLDGSAEVDDVEVDSPAAAAGFMRGDRILAVDEHRADSETKAQRWLEHAGAGSEVVLTVFRGDRLLKLPLKIADNTARTWTFARAAGAHPIRDAWLAGPEPQSGK